MRFPGLREMVAFTIGALVAGCGPAATALPSGSTQQQASSRSRAAGDAKAALLYVSDPATGSVTFYSYPQLQIQGTLTGLSFPLGLCLDPNTHDVWVVDAGARELFEFAHGATTPVRTLSISGYYPELVSCAVSPKNGDLAVVAENFGSDPGGLMIYENASGKPTVYESSKMFFYNFVTYDQNGDAFVDGYGNEFVLAELPYGATNFSDVTPKSLRHLRSRGGVLSDGSQVDVGNEKRGLIYQVADREVSAATSLLDACRVSQFFIDGGRVIAPDACNAKGRVSIYDYPNGGAPVKVLDGFKKPFAVVISR